MRDTGSLHLGKPEAAKPRLCASWSIQRLPEDWRTLLLFTIQRTSGRNTHVVSKFVTLPNFGEGVFGLARYLLSVSVATLELGWRLARKR